MSILSKIKAIVKNSIRLDLKHLTCQHLPPRKPTRDMRVVQIWALSTTASETRPTQNDERRPGHLQHKVQRFPAPSAGSAVSGDLNNTTATEGRPDFSFRCTLRYHPSVEEATERTSLFNNSIARSPCLCRKSTRHLWQKHLE